MTKHQYLHLLHQISQLHQQADGNFTRLIILITLDCVLLMLTLGLIGTRR